MLGDFIAKAVADKGPPKYAQLVSAAEAERYRGRLPDGLIDFWMRYGRGSYNQGHYWLCDPAKFQPVIDTIFNGDPEFAPKDMLIYSYNELGEFNAWHRTKRHVMVDFTFAKVTCAPPESYIDKKTGLFLPDNLSIGLEMYYGGYGTGLHDEQGEMLLPQAIERLGELGPGEIYGFVPAIRLGGDYKAHNLQKMDALAHMLFLAQIGGVAYWRLTEPTPQEPMGHFEFIRPIGPQRP